MRTPDDKLFRLIQSLTRNEKIQFKKQAGTFSKRSESQYLEVFDAIDKQKEYDEAALLEQFSERDFVRQFSVMKKYLYDSIIRVLVDLRSRKDIGLQLANRKAEAEILLERGMEREGFKVLRKAQEKAEANEHDALAVELILCENRWKANFGDRPAGEIQQLFSQANLVSQRLANYLLYLQQYETFMFWHKRERSLRDQAALTELETLMQSASLQRLKQPANFTTRLLFNSIHEKYHQLKDEDDLAISWSAQNVVAFEKHPKMQDLYAMNYFVCWINYLNSLYRQEQTDQLKAALQDFGGFQTKDTQIRRFHFSRYLGLQLALMEQSGDFTSLEEIEKQLKQEWNDSNYQLPVTEWRLLLFNMVKLSIFQQNYEQAQDWCIHLLELEATDRQADLQRFAELLQVLIHYSLGDERLSEHLNTTVRRHLKQQNKLYEYEKTFVKLFQKLLNSPLLNRKSILQKWNKKLLQLKSEESRGFEYFDLQLWVQAELGKCSVASLLRD